MEKRLCFGDNLKFYRTELGLTQGELGEKLGYTAKSVSKWERGSAFPSVEVLLSLSELFNISVDELIREKNSGHYFLGIDGGGTKTLFRLVDENGTEVRSVIKGSGNPNDVGMENAEAMLKEGINEICRGIPFSSVTMFAGIAGGGLTGDNAAILNRFFGKFGFFAYDNGSDVENLFALADSEKCILVIMGTGFIVYAVNGDEQKRISGWGQYFDEGGSGYTIGRDAVSAALADGDGSGKETLLSKLIEARLGETAEKHLAKFYRGGKKYIAEFAELVFTAAEEKDCVALEILEKNMAFAAGKINAGVKALGDSGVQIMFSGGLCKRSEFLFPMIEAGLEQKGCTLTRIESEPVEGAVSRARKIYAAKTQKAN